jgi:hypothetical protein
LLQSFIPRPLGPKGPEVRSTLGGGLHTARVPARRPDDRTRALCWREEREKLSGGGMESKPSETGKLSAPSSEGTGGGGGGGPTVPPTASQAPATTGLTSFPRLPPLPSSSTVGAATSGAQPRGGLAIVAPAHHSTRAHQSFTTFGPSPPPSVQHQHQFLSTMHRVPDSSPSSASQV